MVCNQIHQVAAPRNEAHDRMNDPPQKLFPCGNRLETTALELYDEGGAEKMRNP